MKAVDSLDRLRQMCNLSALSGHEEEMTHYVKGEMSRYLSDIRVDRRGNVIGRMPSKHPDGPSARRTLLLRLAHDPTRSGLSRF